MWNVTERLVAGAERGTAGDVQRAEWLGSTCSRHDEETDDECVGLPLKQGVFPSMIITYALIQMVGKIADENGKVDIINQQLV